MKRHELGLGSWAGSARYLAERTLRLLARDRLVEVVLPPGDGHVREPAVRLLDRVLLDDSGLGRSELPAVVSAEPRRIASRPASSGRRS